jgi:hypothetical protein
MKYIFDFRVTEQSIRWYMWAPGQFGGFKYQDDKKYRVDFTVYNTTHVLDYLKAVYEMLSVLYPRDRRNNYFIAE